MDSTMNSVEVIAVVAIVCSIGLPICTWILFRLLAHRERMEMIRRGLVTQRASYDDASDGSVNVQLRRGISVAFIGLALLIGLSFIGYNDDFGLFGHFILGPWLLGGLVPFFVGIAQIVGALAGGARFGSAGSGPFRPPSPAESSGLTLYQEPRTETEKRPPV